jgi:hypothetical protein
MSNERSLKDAILGFANGAYERGKEIDEITRTAQKMGDVILQAAEDAQERGLT